jgi:hypothetical protein
VARGPPSPVSLALFKDDDWAHVFGGGGSGVRRGEGGGVDADPVGSGV